jgi:hypothetical protein
MRTTGYTHHIASKLWFAGGYYHGNLHFYFTTVSLISVFAILLGDSNSHYLFLSILQKAQNINQRPFDLIGFLAKAPGLQGADMYSLRSFASLREIFGLERQSIVSFIQSMRLFG